MADRPFYPDNPAFLGDDERDAVASRGKALAAALRTMPSVQAMRAPFEGAAAVYNADPHTEEGAAMLNAAQDNAAGWGLGAAALGATGGMPMAEAGAAGIFGGRLAATADRSALARAEEMAASGAPRGDVWNATG